MASAVDSLRGLSDDALVKRLSELVANDRRATAQIISTIAELDVRRLYLAQGYPSLYEYCVGSLHLTEYEAYSRIQAARLSRRFPVVLDLLGVGDVSLTALTVLGPHLNEANYLNVLKEARHKRKAELQEIAARLNPKPAIASVVRRIPAPRLAASIELPIPLSDGAPATSARPEAALLTPASPSQPRPVLKPLAPEIYKVSFTLSRDGRDDLRRAQALLRHSIPSGDLGKVFERALSALLADLDKRKLALVARPRQPSARTALATSRHIPAAVRRDVWRRDKGRCAFVGLEGRCRERGGLELHHVKPFAAGGQATVENIELRCRAHNAHEAEVFFAAQRGP